MIIKIKHFMFHIVTYLVFVIYVKSSLVDTMLIFSYMVFSVNSPLEIHCSFVLWFSVFMLLVGSCWLNIA